jgi:hypothetical protein
MAASMLIESLIHVGDLYDAERFAQMTLDTLKVKLYFAIKLKKVYFSFKKKCIEIFSIFFLLYSGQGRICTYMLI